VLVRNFEFPVSSFEFRSPASGLFLPILAAVGAPEIRLRLENVKQPEDLLKHLKPKPGEPLHFLVEQNPGVEFMPYWQVDEEPFNCFPAVKASA